MNDDFVRVMHKVSTLGQDTSKLVDCSEVIPEPEGYDSPAYFPNGTTYDDVQQACAAMSLPSLVTQPGSTTSVTAK